MFKRMLAAFGVGGPSVDTVLDTPAVMPGQLVRGRVRIQGGSADAAIDQIALSLVTRAELEHGDHEMAGRAEFHRVVVAHGVQVRAGAPLDVPFEFAIPWETPITAVGPTPLPGMVVGVRTELVIAGAPDKGDLDQLTVPPLPSQDRVLDAFGQLGFQFRAADVEVGRLHGVPQELGFYQEIEFFPPAQHAGRVSQVELTFVATPHELWVVLEADKRGGFLRAGGDSFGHFRMPHQQAETADWAPVIDGWLAQVAAGRPQAFGHHDQHHGHHRRGPGMDAGVGGGAAGLVGGMIIGDMLSDDEGGGFEE
ncbi:sporulation protein [Actinokineospora soli]